MSRMYVVRSQGSKPLYAFTESDAGDTVASLLSKGVGRIVVETVEVASEAPAAEAIQCRRTRRRGSSHRVGARGTT